jgi:hypothetical protein
MSTPEEEREPTEEELAAALEQQLRSIRVEQVVLESAVSLLNLGMRRVGVMPGTEEERDLDQAEIAIESVRGLLPQLEQIAPQQAAQIKQALSQLQLAYVQNRGGTAAQEGAPQPGAPRAAEQPGGEQGKEGPGPAESSGRLWVPGR